MTNKPDYDYLLKLESWSKKDAALIVCGFEPQDYRSVRFTHSNIPEKLKEAHKIYRIFCTVDFCRKYGSYQGNPFHYLCECDEKNISIPEALGDAAEQRLAYLRDREERIGQQEQEVAQEPKKEVVDIETAEGARERRYLLKIIGALASVYFAEKDKTLDSPDSKRVVSHLVEDILQYLENNEMQSPGLGKSNLHKKISEGLSIFKEENE